MSRVYNSDVSADTTLLTTAETVVATLGGVSVARPGESVRLHGEATVTTGTATTALALRLRRDSLTGVQVGETITDQVEAAAGSTETHDIVATDPAPGELAGASYVLTVSQTAATGNGSAVHASLEATVGNP